MIRIPGFPLIWAALLFAGSTLAAPSLGKPEPAFVGQTLDGQTFDLAAHRGHIVVVNFWATWCTPCRTEMPMLEAFYKAHKAEGVELIGLSADRHRDLADVRKVMAAFSYPAAVLADAKSNGFGAPRLLPATYVIDAQGTVRAILVAGDKPLTLVALEAAVSAAQTGGK